MAVSSTSGFGRTTTGLLTATVNDIFKEYYLPGVQDLLNSKRILTRYVRQNTEDIEGEKAVIALNNARNTSPQHIGERGTLPDPGTQGYDRATYTLKYYYGRLAFTGPASATSKSNRGAFLRILDGEIRGLARDMQHYLNHKLFGDGSGRMCTWVSNSTNVYTVANPGGFTNTGLGTQYLQVGDRLCLVDASAATWDDTIFAATAGSLESQQITAIDYVNGTITFAAEFTSITEAVADSFSKYPESTTAGTRINTEYLNAPFGLAALVDDGNPHTHGGTGAPSKNVGGIDASTDINWQAFIIDNNGTPMVFSSDLFQQAMDGVDQLGDGQIKMWITSHGIRRQYLNELVGSKRYVNSMTLDGGFRALEYDGIPIVVDKDCTRGRIYGLDLDTLHMFMPMDYEWMDADGSILHRLENNDMYQATLMRYHEFGTNARNRNAGIFDIADN